MKKGNGIAWEIVKGVRLMDGLNSDEDQDESVNEVMSEWHLLQLKNYYVLKIDEEVVVVTGNPDFPDQIRHHQQCLCKSIPLVRYKAHQERWGEEVTYRLIPLVPLIVV